MKVNDKIVFIVIVLVVAIITVISLIYLRVINSTSDLKYLVVKEGDVEIARLSLPVESMLLNISGNWGIMILEIDKYRVRISPSSTHYCPDKICLKKSWIDKPYETIICLPNKVIIYYEGKSYFDGLTY